MATDAGNGGMDDLICWKGVHVGARSQSPIYLRYPNLSYPHATGDFSVAAQGTEWLLAGGKGHKRSSVQAGEPGARLHGCT